MKKDDNILFDDNETAEDLLITDMTEEEIDKEFERILSSGRNSDHLQKNNPPPHLQYGGNGGR